MGKAPSCPPPTPTGSCQPPALPGGLQNDGRRLEGVPKKQASPSRRGEGRCFPASRSKVKPRHCPPQGSEHSAALPALRCRDLPLLPAGSSPPGSHETHRQSRAQCWASNHPETAGSGQGLSPPVAITRADCRLPAGLAPALLCSGRQDLAGHTPTEPREARGTISTSPVMPGRQSVCPGHPIPWHTVPSHPSTSLEVSQHRCKLPGAGSTCGVWCLIP